MSNAPGEAASSSSKRGRRGLAQKAGHAVNDALGGAAAVASDDRALRRHGLKRYEAEVLVLSAACQRRKTRLKRTAHT